jgi:hypothetical protein
MNHTVLLTLCFLSILVVTFSWTYLIAAYALWVFVFGDNSATFGYYALGIAAFVSLPLSSMFLRYALRRAAGPNALGGIILGAVLLEVAFLLCITQ